MALFEELLVAVSDDDKIGLSIPPPAPLGFASLREGDLRQALECPDVSRIESQGEFELVLFSDRVSFSPCQPGAELRDLVGV